MAGYTYTTEDGTEYDFDENGNFIPNNEVVAFSKGAGFDNSRMVYNGSDSSNSSRSGSSSSTGTSSYYSAAQKAANKAQKLAVEQGTTALNAQKANTNDTYDDIAKQVYANYRLNQNKLPSLMTHLASGTADSLKLKQTLNYEDNLNASEKERTEQLAAIDTDISELETSGDISIANNAEKYALLRHQEASELAQQAYALKLKELELALKQLNQ